MPAGQGEEQKRLCVVGAGLVGCLSAIGFAKKGYAVTVIEYRNDPRDDSTSDRNLRSINLAISDRAFRAIKHVDEALLEKILDKVIPMHGRMIHDLEGHQESQLYGLYGECINSIDRSYLNRVLLDEMDTISGIQIKFGSKLTDLRFEGAEETPVVEITGGRDRTTQRLQFDVVLGADGAFSATRHHLQKKVRMNFTQEYIDTCYIELYIPPGPNGSFLIDPNHLHIWPRSKFMLIALANKDGSFTSTFFGPWKLAESLNTESAVLEFFNTNFKDAIDLIGKEKLVEAFLNNPKGTLLQIHCNPYNYKGKAILVGDAAHAMVPFYGQGMNCGFESVRVLLESLEQHDGDTEAAFSHYSAQRHQDLEAILELALANYHEMSHKVTSVMYLMRKRIDGLLNRTLKDRWLPLYTMVSFRGDISYSEAIRTERRQQKILKRAQFAVFAAGAVVAAIKAYKYVERFTKR